MNSNVIKLLLGLCVFSLLILLVEFEFFGLSSNQLQGAPINTEKQQEQQIKLPQIVLSKKPMDSYSDMIEKPLFIKGRKPVVVDAVEDGPIEELGAIEDLVLVGIYSTEDRLVALLSQPKADKKFLKKSEGDDVSGFLLKEIQFDRVILERGGKKQPLMLRKPRPKSKVKPKIKRKVKPKKTKPLKRKKMKPKS
jgi:type II secretory pathway component PulC